MRPIPRSVTTQVVRESGNMDRFWRKGDGLGPRDLSSMSVRDTKLNVCERHKTRRKGDGLGPRDLSSWRENLVTLADSGLSRTGQQRKSGNKGRLVAAKNW